MLQAMLELFTTKQKAEAMLASPIIEIIFIELFILFIVTLIVHFSLYFKIRQTRNYVKETNRMDIDPLLSIKTEFDARQAKESMKVETFVQEKFSNWRMFQIPVVSLIKMVQMTISVFILLGVLGTFIGLTISLSSVNPVGDQIVENIAGVLSGIDVAFYTSIVGMSFSLIMTVLIRVLNTEYMVTDLMLIVESHLESHELHGMNKMIEVSEVIHGSIENLQATNEKSLQSIVESFHGFKDYTSGLQKSAEDLAKFNDGLSENLADFQELFQQMKVVTDGFGEGTAQLNENFASLFSYFQKIDRKNERIATVFEQTYEKIQDVSQAQVDSLQTFDASVTELKEFTASLLEGQADVRDALENIVQKTHGLVDTIGAYQRALKEIFGDDLGARLSGIATYLGELSKGFDRVGESITTLPEALEVINQTQAEHKHLLADRFQELKHFNQTFHDHLKKHETDSISFEKHMRDAASTYELMATKNNQLISEINRMVTDMNQTFTDREQKLESNVGALRDNLASHLTNVEGTLGQKLDTMIRSIDNSLYSLSEGMNRELMEMRRVSEDINQNHARLMQQLLQELGREIQTLNRQLTSIGQQTIQPNRRIGIDKDEY